MILTTWAGGLWINPFGPVIYDVAWLPFLIMGFFIILLLAAAVPPTPPTTRAEAIEQARETEATTTALTGLSIFFWIIIIFSAIAIILAYVL